MTLVLFDVDGTLTATGECDMKCYSATFTKLFGAPLPYEDWHAYKHFTDGGVIGEALEHIRGSFVTQDELVRFEREFVRELEGEYDQNPGAFAEIPGAKSVLDRIERTPDLRAALASGGFRASALYKLSKIGVDGSRLPGAFGNDSFIREEIAQCAIRRTNANTSDIVYVGDGLWDVRMSALLGMRFIGVTRESSEEKLRNAGASICLPDYADDAAFFVAVKTARVPVSANAH